MFLLGLDVGTSSLKAVLIDGDGRVLASASSPYEVDRPHEGWSEQPPSRWWAAACDAIPRLLSGASASGKSVPAKSIRAVGLSGQMHGSVFLDCASIKSAATAPIEAIRPALLWNDQRTAAQCAAIEHAIGGRAALVRAVGNAALTGFTLPKTLWLRDHEPANFARLAAGGGVCNPKDFIRLQLTGALATDIGDAAGTILVNVDTRTWHLGLCRTLNLDPAILPPILESAAIAGHITPWAASQTGLAPGTAVVAGSGDNQAGAIGAGLVTSGLALATLGTSGVIFAHMREPRKDLPADPSQPCGRLHTMCAADGSSRSPGHWSITGVTLAAAGSLHWARDTIAPGVPFETLLAEAAAIPPGAEGLLFLPYLTGERCPHPDPHARACWIGLTARHTRAHLIRAVLEGVTFSLRQCLDLVRALPVDVQRIRLGGGGSKSPLWRQLQADIYELPVATLNCDEGPAYGAALMAGVGADHWPSVEAACNATIHETEVLHPDTQTSARYHQPRALYANLYSQLQPTFAAIRTI